MNEHEVGEFSHRQALGPVGIGMAAAAAPALAQKGKRVPQPDLPETRT